MTNYNRREFLKQVALGGVGLGALASRELGQPLLSLVEKSIIPLTAFWQGQVSSVLPNGLTVHGSGIAFDGVMPVSLKNGRITDLGIQVDADTRVWKGQHVDLSAVEQDDVVYGRGLIMFDGSILAQRLWVNIAQYRGSVLERAKGILLLEVAENPPAHITVLFDTETLINDGQGNEEDISAGRYIQVLGVMQKDGKLKATRIWA